uniref:Uncharacterized protein n=1 Tax=Acanthochromis polyacanthus TaxID=80966 RepID=A0A3Q1G0G8_9TELE
THTLSYFMWSAASQTTLITPFDMWPFHLLADNKQPTHMSPILHVYRVLPHSFCSIWTVAVLMHLMFSS